MSASRAKGTRGENYFLGPLRRIFGDHVDRSPLRGIHDFGDFTGTGGLLVESKHTLKPLFQQWARICEKKAGKRWVLLYKGDTRTSTGNGPYALMPLDLFEEMASTWVERGGPEGAAVRALLRVDV
jgi:hypothetical protein